MHSSFGAVAAVRGVQLVDEVEVCGLAAAPDQRVSFCTTGSTEPLRSSLLDFTLTV